MLSRETELSSLQHLKLLFKIRAPGTALPARGRVPGFTRYCDLAHLTQILLYTVSPFVWSTGTSGYDEC